MPLLIQYRFSPMEAYQTDYSADLSQGGMFIHSERPHPVGTIIYVQFITRNGERVIKGQGRIVRIATGEGPQQRRGQAVEFIGFDEEDVRFMQALVRQRLEQEESPPLRVSKRVREESDPDE